jgi:hypothetical protein
VNNRNPGVLGACAFIVFAAMVQALPASAQTSPLSGTWSEEAVVGPARPPWGARFSTMHDHSRFTVVSPAGVSTYTLDGTPSDTQLALTSCFSTVRRTVAVERRGEIVITESIVTSGRSNPRAHAPCLFDDSEEPRITAPGAGHGGVALDVVIVISRQGDRLVVELTRRGAQGPVSTRAVYRPAGQ